MKKRGRLGCWLGFGALALVLLCTTVVVFMYTHLRSRALNSRPLVLIHSPVNHEWAQVGEGTLVHATARAARGVTRMELWVDEVLVAARDSTAERPVSPMVFSTTWTPASIGSHTLLIHAVSADGVDGQAAIVLEVVGEEGAELGGHTVQEGENFASIAEQYGVSGEELARLNPGADPGGVDAGDQLTVPGGEEASGVPGAGAAEEPGTGMTGDGPAPVPEDLAPGDFFNLLWHLVPLDLGPRPGLSDDPVGLRLEALSLQTDTVYESLHCYIGVADGLPRLYPDADGDQSTDESFAHLGDRTWNVADYLSGEAAPIITWPGNQPLSLDATCVGILGGGTDAVQLGRLLLEIPQGEWDGVARWSPEVSNEGSFSLEYRVSLAVEYGGEARTSVDPSMTAPTDLRLAGFTTTGHSLYWSYEPRPEEAPIDGFRIYMNGTLLWVEPADARTTAVPSQWLFPCVDPYTFTVTAFRGTYPEGPESTPSAPPVIIEAEPAHCERVVYLTFLRLITHDLGGDGRFEDRSGDVGPAYGYFYGNDQQVSFDGRPDDSRQGLNHNSQYVIRDLWHMSGPSQLRVELDEGEYLATGFRIDNEDTGHCDDASDPGCDNLICDGEEMLDVDVDTTSEERTLRSRDGRCEVTYTIALGSGFPAEGYGGELPLPWLTVDDLTMTEASQIRIHVRNSGRASWPSREVKAAITTHAGEVLDVLAWPAMSLAPGETTILQSATMDFGPLPACVILDPDNEVQEEGDRLESTGVLMAHAPFCMRLPDLVINGVEYDPEASQLLVAVQNQGEGVLEDRTIGLSQRPLDEGPAAEPVEHSLVSLGPWESTVFSMAADESLHSQWFRGYAVVVDPDHLIVESNDANNSYSVPSGGNIRLAWTDIKAPWQARNGVEFELRASIISAGSRRQIADWRIAQDIDWTECLHDPTHGECEKNYDPVSPFDTGPVQIAGDEALEIHVSISNERALEDDFGHRFTWLSAEETYRVEEAWGAGEPDHTRGCTMVIGGPGDHGWTLGSYSEWAPSLGYWHDWDWYVNFNLCH